MPENRMDVLRFEADGTIVGKALHPVDERCNTIDLVTDEPCQRLLRLARRALKKLSRAANARQRVLDFVRKHRCSTGRRAGSPLPHRFPVDERCTGAGVDGYAAPARWELGREPGGERESG